MNHTTARKKKNILVEGDEDNLSDGVVSLHRLLSVEGEWLWDEGMGMGGGEGVR